MGNVAFGLVFLIIGLAFLIFNKSVTRWHVEIQTFFFRYHFSDRDRVMTRIIFIIGGIFSSAVGIVVLLSALSLI
jgi:hypothetical protein